MKIGIGNDHSALELKAEIVEFLKEKGHEVVDYGTYTSESCDYPVYGEKVARAVVAGEVEKGILICGTGLGISLAANKVKGIRACVCSEPFTAKMSRAHNDCNVLAFGARVVGGELAKMIVDTWINTEFEGADHREGNRTHRSGYTGGSERLFLPFLCTEQCHSGSETAKRNHASTATY